MIDAKDRPAMVRTSPSGADQGQEPLRATYDTQVKDTSGQSDDCYLRLFTKGQTSTGGSSQRPATALSADAARAAAPDIVELNRKPQPPSFHLPMERLLLRPAETAELIGMGRAKTYALIREGTIPSVRLGASLRVPTEQLRA